MRFRKALARKKRKEREAAGEIKELNITAMMDMMTILLVFLLKSFASSSASITASDDVKPPVSSTRATPKDTVAVTITPKNILVGEKEVLRLTNGQVPAEQLQGRLVAPLDAALKKEVEKLKYIADRNPAAPFNRELSVIGDKRVPYDLLLTVLYTAGQNELENYRFVVLQKEEGGQ
ncbi:ExbD/TolR family protein [Hyalangium minutum]|uniref:Adventurous gliding motility protein S n=1 Tax=Hyalangium minutum TaxID=394096 RepID=A0A085W358_9BACT|nr:adventurous gliding motility protein S [Hyalangium minutum]